jgi:hypothetical protein
MPLHARAVEIEIIRSFASDAKPPLVLVLQILQTLDALCFESSYHLGFRMQVCSHQCLLEKNKSEKDDIGGSSNKVNVM